MRDVPSEVPRPIVWSYREAFIRNLGLITEDEQERLRRSRAAVVGLGGVGGVDVVALARMGVGKFSIADPDVFEIKNSNRQYGATLSAFGRPKAEVMGNIIQEINPEADIRIFREPIGPSNAEAFLEGADVLVDGIDAFEIDLRRLLFGMARERGIFALGAGPVGFSTVWVVFDPKGMSFDRYFDLSDNLDPIQKFVAYVVGMAPSMLQRKYMNLAYLDFAGRSGPSAALACQLASGVVAAEVLKILVGRGAIRPAPTYHQFDAFRGLFVRRHLYGGNRNPLQRIKRRWLTNYIRQQMNAG